MDSIRHVDFWFQKPPGSLVLEQEKVILDHLLSTLSGDVLLQVGGPSQLCLFQSSQITHHIYASLDGVSSESMPTFEADLDALPLRNESLDCIVMFHTLAYSSDPERLLKKLFQALKAGGKLILFGFNKYSLWGMAKLTRDKRLFPWGGRFHSPWRVKRWIRAADFILLSDQAVCFRGPTVSKEKWFKNRYMEVFGSTLFPVFSGVYMFYAYKEQEGMMPLLDLGGLKRRKKYPDSAEPSLRTKLKKDIV